MFKEVTPERVINIAWLSVAASCCWPLPFNSNRKQKFVYKSLQIYDAISACTAILALAYSVHVHIDDIITVCKCICCTVGLSQIIAQSFICDIKHDLLQRVVAEMVVCVKEAKKFERKIFSKYIAKCKMLYGCSITFIYATTSAILLGPMVSTSPFPMDIEYPFSINKTSVYIILYIHQFILICQGTAHLCMCVFGALMLWFTAARFECLAVEFQKIGDVDMLIICIKKQLYLMRYAEDVTSCFRFVILYAIGVNTLATILCGLLLITNAASLVKAQFTLLCFTALMEIFMYAWPADYLMEMVNYVHTFMCNLLTRRVQVLRDTDLVETSVSASQSVYDISWYQLNVEMKKNVLNVLVYQKPVVLSVSFVLSELSLRYFCSFLSNAFSIFTTLRVAVNGD